MIISVSKKKFFNSILPVLKSFSFREINDFVSFCFIFSFIPYEYWAGGGGGRGLQSTHNISVNAFARDKPIFICRRCELITPEFTFGFHVTRSQNSPLGYNRVKPVFAADRLSSFAHFDFLASLRRQLRNGTERDWKK